MIKIKAEKRAKLGKRTHSLRRAGQLPAVVYGKEFKALSLQIGYKDFIKVYQKAAKSTLVNLDIADDKKTVPVLIHDVQTAPVSGRFLHVDFYCVRMDEKLKADVDLEFKGQSPAVKEQGGILVKNFDTLEVEALPADLPAKIIVDISRLKTFDDVIAIKDLAISKKVKITAAPDEVVAVVTPPRSEEELKKLEEEATEDVESVEGVKKEEKPEGEEEKAVEGEAAKPEGEAAKDEKKPEKGAAAPGKEAAADKKADK